MNSNIAAILKFFRATGKAIARVSAAADRDNREAVRTLALVWRTIEKAFARSRGYLALALGLFIVVSMIYALYFMPFMDDGVAYEIIKIILVALTVYFEVAFLVSADVKARFLKRFEDVTGIAIKLPGVSVSIELKRSKRKVQSPPSVIESYVRGGISPSILATVLGIATSCAVGFAERSWVNAIIGITISLVPGIFCALTLVRERLGLLGTNSREAAEIIGFMIKKAAEDGQPPSGPMRRRVESVSAVAEFDGHSATKPA